MTKRINTYKSTSEVMLILGCGVLIDENMQNFCGVALLWKVVIGNVLLFKNRIYLKSRYVYIAVSRINVNQIFHKQFLLCEVSCDRCFSELNFETFDIFYFICM